MKNTQYSITLPDQPRNELPLKNITEPAQSLPSTTTNPQEGWGEWLLRNATRVGSNIASAPFAVGNLLNSYGEFRKSMLPTQEQFEGLNLPGPVKDIYGPSLKEARGEDALLQRVIPTQEDVIGKIKPYLPAGYLDPKGNTEEILSGFASDLPWIAMFGGAPFWQKALASGGGKVARQAAKGAGYGPLGQAIADIGGSVGADAIFRKLRPGKFLEGMVDLERKGYEKSKDLLKNVERLPASHLDDTLESLLKDTERHPHDYLKFAKKHLEAAKEVIKNKKASVQDVIEKKRDLNQLFTIKETPEKAEPIIKRAVGAMNSFIEDYAQKNPKFKQSYYNAENLHKALIKSKKADEFIKNNVDWNLFTSNTTGKMLGLLLAHGKRGASVYRSTLFNPNIFFRNPDIIKHIGNAFLEASNRNKGAMMSHLLKADKLIAPLEKKNTNYTVTLPE